MDYQEAGVDVEAGRAFVDRIRDSVESTYRPEVLGGLGGFGGCFQLPGGYREPVLVSGTDGVGTKLKIARHCDRHETIGIDLVAMCVNDVLTSGAQPLFFLDYLATSQLNPEQLESVVVGIARGCREAGCALLGGETAEMPGFYQPGEYDLAGFCVGIVEKSEILDGSRVRVGDIVIGLASSGVHSNGFSLVRKIVEKTGMGWDEIPTGFTRSLGELFLTPTRIYVQPILAALAGELNIHSMAHITGGGLPENLPRCLGKNQSVAINWDAWEIPPIFNWLADRGEVPDDDMFNTFNMGVGFAVIVDRKQENLALEFFQSRGIESFTLGEIVPGNGELLGDRAPR
ncbi:phosphoribosylformylglycinamidine cyclo-ligase [Roseofilum casamattae]|uniref:Phosphoribosylformylglycinamidine cyclo-ligase n=1 Tax=Roseofilum casamattae BLCC-M143 TaxID=3022442 RepID=A0ABT7BYV6_9CYAN|nr:phosphoribosylformylglycinamidine cyclo-ligase [Roseofilum casamattae]MDJ1184375.1 phosphoribosylformylglycinamidine cyclo-ligase [Roseofilum casamattae BLCC-M143]